MIDLATTKSLVTLFLLAGAVWGLSVLIPKVWQFYRKWTAPKTCKNCRHFDFQEGQAAMPSHPSFIQAAAVLPPSLMGSPVDEYGNRTRHKGLPLAAKWNEFGACQVDPEDGHLRWGGDSCEKWSRK